MTDWPTITVHEYEDGGQPVVPVTTLRFNGVSIPGGTHYLIPKDKVRRVDERFVTFEDTRAIPHGDYSLLIVEDTDD